MGRVIGGVLPSELNRFFFTQQSTGLWLIASPTTRYPPIPLRRWRQFGGVAASAAAAARWKARRQHGGGGGGSGSLVAVQRWRQRQRGGCGQCGGNAAAAAAGNATVAAAAWTAVRHQRGGGGGGSAAVAWRRWRWRQCGSSAAAAEAAAAWRRQRVGGGVGSEAAACCSITDLEALYLWRNPVFRIKKAEKVNFYLRHNFKEKWNLSLDFQRIQIYSIANKNQKRITADTHSVPQNFVVLPFFLWIKG